MTAQIADHFSYKGEGYSIVAMKGEIKFNPKKYGFHPESPSSACWRGYWCEFLVTDDSLVLDKLHIFQREHDYPEFNGVRAELNQEGWDRMPVYNDLNFKINYTGSIVLGKGFLDKYYIHMGYQRAWAYETVIELVFEKGKVVNRIDHSDFVAKIREGIEEDPAGFWKKIDPDVGTFVDESFSLDARIKAWWI